MRYVAVRRPDTLCVRGVFPLFLLTQRLVAFGDINYVGETTLIVTINSVEEALHQNDPFFDTDSCRKIIESLVRLLIE